MLRIGLTGGIGSGKSAVSRLLAQHGAVVVDADLIAREVVEPGTPGLAAIVEEFGAEVLRPDGTLDRERLGAIVFGDSSARLRLNAIVHPLVGARSAEIVATAPPDAVLVHDVPLLVENGLAPQYDLVVVVDAPAEVRIDRLVRDRGMTEEAARARIGAQATDAERRDVADVVIANDGTLDDLRARVDAFWAERVEPALRRMPDSTI
jgi:dephospho-CoA kinase